MKERGRFYFNKPVLEHWPKIMQGKQNPYVETEEIMPHPVRREVQFGAGQEHLREGEMKRRMAEKQESSWSTNRCQL